jgi:protein-disulfide isomerase
MRHIKSLVVFTFVILIIAAGVIYYLCSTELPEGIALETKGQPTIGYPKARVHVVVFEEPKCSNCRTYNNEVFPKIKKEFIDTNKIRYTVIPVSFLPGSMPAAVALLCVYYANPEYPNDEMFIKYFDYIYDYQPDEHTDWATPDKLAEFAEKTSPAIEIGKLKKCIEMEKYRIQIEKNTAYGAEVMGGVISTPTVYVNGIEVKELTVDGMSKLIREVLEHEGVY